MPRRSFLLLQGPTNFLFAKIALDLRGRGHDVHRINICLGDQLFWRGPGAVDFRGRPGEWPDFIARFLEQRRVTDLLLLGEKREHHMVAIAAARARGIAVTVTDFGYLRPDWIVVEREGMNADSRFPRDPKVIREMAVGLPAIDRRVRYPHRPVNQALWDMAFHLSSAFWPWTFPHFRRHTLNHPLANYLGTGIRLASGIFRKRIDGTGIPAPFYVYAMQMEDDYSVRAYSRYADLDAAMEEVIRSFAVHAPREAHLVFKVHPLDPGLKSWGRRIERMAKSAGVEARVHFIDGGDLDELLGQSAGLITINSTAGLRALELLCPTIALGEAIYRIPGLAFEGALDRFWIEAKKPDADFVDATLRLMGAMLHVRGSFYDREGIEAAAQGMAHRLHHGLVNAPIPEVLRGEVPGR